MDEKKYFAAVLDMETTGLDARHEVPLEVGIKLIDVFGEVYAEESWLVYEEGKTYENARNEADPFVQNMHVASGLWVDLDTARSSAIQVNTRAEADESMCKWLDDQGVRFGTLPMMGNSIGSLDRPFALIHFPNLNNTLSYRNIDMSTVRLLLKANNPGLWENVEPLVGGSADSQHRVLDDIDACIREYKVYRDEFLICGEEF